MFELITATELRKKLSAGMKIDIVDARRTDAFETGGIPGAINMLWEDWCEDAPSSASAILHQPGWWGRLEDISPFELETKLADLGLSSERQIVVYADGVKSKGRDGRIAWMLLYFGSKHVSILNGGWEGWIKDGGEIELEHQRPEHKRLEQKRPPEQSSFEVHFDSTRRVQLKDLIGTKIMCSVDTRTREEHQGAIYIYQPRLGRIPNSVNIPFSTLYKSSGEFLSRDEFLQVLQSNQLGDTHQKNENDGSQNDGTNNEGRQSEEARLLYSYCEVGVRAATFALLYELYTGDTLPVFDGSFMEWSYNFELPIERD
jgi:thiosulfate/3-mercaptopyruvate sulfurtransferase